MDRAYANALKRQQKLERELAKVNSFIEMYREFFGSEEEQSEPSGRESAESQTEETLSPRTHRRLRPPEIADLAERVIRDAGHPLTRAEIVLRLENGGVELNSEDKPRYVGTILWREKTRFTNIPGEGYTMADMATGQQNIIDLIDRTASEEEPDVEKDKGVFR